MISGSVMNRKENVKMWDDERNMADKLDRAFAPIETRSSIGRGTNIFCMAFQLKGNHQLGMCKLFSKNPDV